MVDWRRFRSAQKVKINILDKSMNNTELTDKEYNNFNIKNGFPFPEKLKELYKDYNGFSGMIGESYVSIFPLNDLYDLNKSYEVDIYFQGFVIFGSDGGGEAYGFLKDVEFSIYRVPFVGMCENEKILITNEINDFIYKLEHGKIYE